MSVGLRMDNGLARLFAVPLVAGAAGCAASRLHVEFGPGSDHAAALAPIPASGNDCCETRKQMLE
jgi:hypothetical protein